MKLTSANLRSTWRLAQDLGVSPTQVRRAAAALGLKPSLVVDDREFYPATAEIADAIAARLRQAERPGRVPAQV